MRNNAASHGACAVASVKVLDNPFSAEYGQLAGGVAEVETGSGTDQWKYLVTNLFPRFRWRGGGFRALESITPRFTVSGPLSKDKLYLFQSFDYRFVRVPVGSFPALSRDQQFETFDSSTQVDWSISESHHLSTNFAFYPEITKYADLNTFNPQPVTPDFHQRGYMLSFHDRDVVGEDLLETSFSVKRSDFDVYNIPTFQDYPAETVTCYAVDGSMIGDPVTFDHTLTSSGLRLPHSVAWTLQVGSRDNARDDLAAGV